MRNEYKDLDRIPERKRQLGKPRRRWEDNIRMDVREIGRDVLYWMHLAQDMDQWRVP
jgi:hypothetical protein